MKKLPVGMQSFRNLIEEGYVYVDKTELIFKLVSKGGKFYFLTRPRRFGKSLLVSTLKALFGGKRELFEGLWIYGRFEWNVEPVIHLDFTAMAYDSGDALKESLCGAMGRIAEDYGIRLEAGHFKTRFSELIEKLSAFGQVVILVDEYDKPIIDHIEDPGKVAVNRGILSDFYSVIKARDTNLKFVFITGVSKFSKVSVFSGLNNLNDITLDDDFATLLGYTEDELLRYFDSYLGQLAERMQLEPETLLDRVREIYDGYSWDGKSFVYNPFSILLLFDKMKFNNYWFATGTPTFLIKLLNEGKLDIRELENLKAGNLFFDSFDIDHIDPVALLFQTGYLTVKKEETAGMFVEYELSYPNCEVENAFLKYFLADKVGRSPNATDMMIRDIARKLTAGDIDGFFEAVSSVFASIPYDLFIGHLEAYYHTVIYLILKLVGIHILPEVHTNIGRTDAVIETDNAVYIMEFKMGTSEEAMAQIKEKKYYEPYLNSNKTITLCAAGFDPANRNITSHQSETL
jgi:hypothetical protein